MKLKSYRYKHETTCKGKLEDIPRKPKAMPKPKVQPIIQEVREVQQPVVQQAVCAKHKRPKSNHPTQ